MSGNSIKDVADRLYQERPSEMLYRYTSMSGMMGIAASRCIWASEIRYLNDAMELRGLLEFIRKITKSVPKTVGGSAQIALQFADWLEDRLQNGPLVFVASFTEKGNLLSQWRGYTPHGQGVSLGFNPSNLEGIIDGLPFKLGRCRYYVGEPDWFFGEIFNNIFAGANGRDFTGPYPPERRYYPYFEEIEADVLRICALLKHGSFLEEAEWRAVSTLYAPGNIPEVEFRQGASFLVPYKRLPLAKQDEPLEIAHVVIGPTPTPELSLRSAGMYLRSVPNVNVAGIENCNIPYRG